MDVKEIKELAEMMQSCGLTSLEIEKSDSRLKLERKQEVIYAAPANVNLAGIAGASLPVGAAELSGGTGMDLSGSFEIEDGTVIVTPMVGVFYTSPSPDSDAFVEVGGRVNKGDVLCIIEAMKLMNEIVSEYDGIITEICADNGEVVEAGQPIFRMEIKE